MEVSGNTAYDDNILSKFQISAMSVMVINFPLV